MFGITLQQLRKIAAAVEAVVESWVQASARAIERAWGLGRARATLKDAEWKEVTPEQVPRTFSEEEKLTIDFLQQQGAARIRHLGDEIKAGVVAKTLEEMGKTLTEANVRGLIRDQIALGKMRGDTLNSIVRNLKDMLGRYDRDWRRVVLTEVWSAKQKAMAHMMAHKESIYEHGEGLDSQVAVISAANACPDCVRVYGPRESPKVFSLKTLMETVNEGGSHLSWKAVVPPLHPRCGCHIRYVPKTLPKAQTQKAK